MALRSPESSAPVTYHHSVRDSGCAPKSRGKRSGGALTSAASDVPARAVTSAARSERRESMRKDGTLPGTSRARWSRPGERRLNAAILSTRLARRSVAPPRAPPPRRNSDEPPDLSCFRRPCLRRCRRGARRVRRHVVDDGRRLGNELLRVEHGLG